MARALAPLVEGATITDAWWDWAPTIRYPAPEAFAAGVAGRRIERVGRRAKWLVLDLSEDIVLLIQVKMTVTTDIRIVKNSRSPTTSVTGKLYSKE